ncbi:hypothetical protein Mapa_017484 [Marchantia paleacea]|nr:hypothetical protein Mapa_017484 [Marchantia paleacea]
MAGTSKLAVINLMKCTSCILLVLLSFVRTGTCVNTKVQFNSCVYVKTTADPGFSVAAAQLMNKMANEFQTRLAVEQAREWTENLSANGYTVSGALRCNNEVQTVSECQTCINAAKDLLVTQFCAPLWNARIILEDCVMRFSYYQLYSVDDQDCYI